MKYFGVCNDHLCPQIGNTALLNAAHQGHIDVVELLLTHGASVNLQNDVRISCVRMNVGGKELNYFALFIRVVSCVHTRTGRRLCLRSSRCLHVCFIDV